MSYYLEVEKQKVSLRVTTSKMKNQSFTSSTKSNWKNEKFQSELLIRKNKNKKKKNKKNKKSWFQIIFTQDSFIQMKYYTIQKYLKRL